MYTDNKMLRHIILVGIIFVQTLKILQRTTNKEIKIYCVDCLDEELENNYKIFSSLGYPKKLLRLNTILQENSY